jgi:hypothetical protein
VKDGPLLVLALLVAAVILPGVAATGGAGWTTLAPLPQVSGGGPSWLSYDGSGTVYALAGGSLVAAYDVKTDSWSYLGSLPTDLWDGASMAYAAGHLFVLRGREPNSGVGQTDFWRYDFNSGSWATIHAAPGPVGDGSSIVWDGGSFLYVAEGEDHHSFPANDFWRYDIGNDSWSVLGTMPFLVQGGTGVTLGRPGTVYGSDPYGQALWSYDIGQNAWTKVTSLPDGGGWGSVPAFDGNSTIYVSRGNYEADFWAYSAADGWSTLVSSPAPIANPGSMVYANGRVYALEGKECSIVSGQEYCMASGNFWAYAASTPPQSTSTASSTTRGASTAAAYGNVTLAASASTIPAIDGVLSPGEWSDAARADFVLPIFVGGGAPTESYPATLYEKNDGTYLYLALVIQGVHYNAWTSNLSRQVDSVNFYFDNTHDGNIAWQADQGDDAVLVKVGLQAEDAFAAVNLPQAGNGTSFQDDVYYGGTSDLNAAYSHTNPVPGGVGNLTLELRKPLDSGDLRHDFALSPGSSVGIFLELDETPAGANYGYMSLWPGPQDCFPPSDGVKCGEATIVIEPGSQNATSVLATPSAYSAATLARASSSAGQASSAANSALPGSVGLSQDEVYLIVAAMIIVGYLVYRSKTKDISRNNPTSG